MQQGERVIVKLDPDYNPTGKPMPDTLLEQMKADPDFEKLSETEQQKVISKVKNMIKDVEDVEKYGTLKEKFNKIVSFNYFILNKEGMLCVTLTDNVATDTYKVVEKKSPTPGSFFAMVGDNICVEKSLDLLHEGSPINAGQCVLNLMATENLDAGGFFNKLTKEKYKLAEITAPISGVIFSLCQMKKDDAVQVLWNDDLFIVSNIPDDTREEAIKWYKETTGKVPKYKTKADKQREAAEQKKNVDSFLSKWDL